MTNFDINLDSIVGSSLQIKASGSIIQDIENDLKLPDGKCIEKLLDNEKNIKKSTENNQR
jgi:hypothetical protein